MKRLKFLAYSFLLLLFASCANDTPLPFVEFDGLGKGAFPRLIDGVNGEYNFFDVANASISFTVEFYDDAQGKNVASYSWTVAHGPSGTGPVQVASVDASSFGTSPDGYPSASFTFTMQGAMDALGITIDDVTGGDAFDYQAKLVKTDGSVFTSTNTGTNVVGSSTFKALFEYQAAVICPSTLEGTFDASNVAWCGDPWTGTIRWENEGKGVYNVYAVNDSGEEQVDMSMGSYWPCYGTAAAMPDGNLRLNDACNRLFFTGASQWGELYWFNSVTVDGPNLTLDWENDYGEGGVVTLTRQDGNDWPPLYK
jgi:hypothetical protein